MSSRLRLFLIPESRPFGVSTHTERTVDALDTSPGKYSSPNRSDQHEHLSINTNGRPAGSAGRSGTMKRELGQPG